MGFLILLGCTSVSRAGFEEFFAERVKDFGPVARGPMLTHYYKFTNTSNQTLTIRSVRVSCGCTTAFAPIANIAPGESSYIGANMDSRRFVGHKSVEIYIDFSAPRFETVTLTIQANGRDDFAMNPETMAFGAIRKGTSPVSTVHVTLMTDPNWKIEEVKADSNYVQPKATLLRRNGAEVTYEISASLRADLPVGKWYTDVWLKSSNPGFAKLRVPLTVEVTPSISVNPGTLQFTEVKVGESSEQNVLVRGDKPFKIKEIRGIDSQVRVSGMGAEAKAVHVLKVVYTPTKSGEVVKTLAVFAEGDTEPAVTIPIKATSTNE
jgi:hypothetical protein